VIATFAGKIPILGVCLGHQGICEVFGATVSYAKNLKHGKASEISIDTTCPIFAGLPQRISGGRYHSLAAVEETMPDTLQITARSSDGEIMGVSHRDYQVYGLQFHPESILTPNGKPMLSNFFNIHEE
jgi:anthranilate synthase component 2